jgi:hypothetical protein
VTRSYLLARRLWTLIEPIHIVTYFSVEPLSTLANAGYKGFWMGYFAGRAAPLGPVGADLVFSTFYNFSFQHVSRAIPDAWSFAPPSAALEARQRGSVEALQRAFAELEIGDDLHRAVEHLRRAALSAPEGGRALFAANRGLPWPEEPVAALWHACTLLREHRGDGHVSALVAAGIGGREANALQVAAGTVPREVFNVARHYDDDEWRDVAQGLMDRGLIDSSGRLTDHGVELRSEVEDRTDRAALTAFDSLNDQQLEFLMDSLTPLARAVIRTGDIPDVTPLACN